MLHYRKSAWLLAFLLITGGEGNVPQNRIHSQIDNLLMDLVLDELKAYIITHKETVITIPPVINNFEYDVVGIPVTGYFNTSEGTFTNPATIRRLGNVNTTHTSGKVVTSMLVGFSQLDVSFPKYHASVIGISESGSIDITIQRNAVFIEVTVLFIPHCIITISKLELQRMNGIIVDMTGLGVLNSVEGQIVAWLLQAYRSSFTRVVENVVRIKLQDLMAKTKICKFKKPY